MKKPKRSKDSGKHGHLFCLGFHVDVFIFFPGSGDEAEGSDSELYAQEQAKIDRERSLIAENNNLNDQVYKSLQFLTESSVAIGGNF